MCDGGIYNNVPIFKDGVRRQLVFRLFDVEYPFRFLVKPLDTCIDMLVLRGAIIMQRFLEGQPADTVAWLDPKLQPEVSSLIGRRVGELRAMKEGGRLLLII